MSRGQGFKRRLFRPLKKLERPLTPAGPANRVTFTLLKKGEPKVFFLRFPFPRTRAASQRWHAREGAGEYPGDVWIRRGVTHCRG